MPVTNNNKKSPNPYTINCNQCNGLYVKVKVTLQEAEVDQGVPVVKAPDFRDVGTTRVVGRQPYAPAAFTPGEIPGTHFQRLSRPQGTWFRRGEPRKKFPLTPPGIDPGTVRLVAQCLNHYATPDPNGLYVYNNIQERLEPQSR